MEILTVGRLVDPGSKANIRKPLKEAIDVFDLAHYIPYV
jgi:hypothetical protein